MCPTSVQMHVYHFHRVWRHLLVLFLLESSPWTGPTSLGGSPCWTRAMSHKKIPGWWPERTACKWSWKASAAHKHHPPESSQGNAGWREGLTPARHTALSSQRQQRNLPQPRRHWMIRRRGCRSAGGAWRCRSSQSWGSRRPTFCCPGRWVRFLQSLRPLWRGGSPTAALSLIPKQNTKAHFSQNINTNF